MAWNDESYTHGEFSAGASGTHWPGKIGGPTTKFERTMSPEPYKLNPIDDVFIRGFGFEKIRAAILNRDFTRVGYKNTGLNCRWNPRHFITRNEEGFCVSEAEIVDDTTIRCRGPYFECMEPLGPTAYMVTEVDVRVQDVPVLPRQLCGSAEWLYLDEGDSLSTSPSGSPPMEEARESEVARHNARREGRMQELVVRDLNCLHVGLMREPVV